VITEVAQGVARQMREGVLRPRVVQVLRDLGGFSLLIERTIGAVLQQYSENPRALPNLRIVSDQLYAEIPELRLRSQELLARINLDRSYQVGPTENASASNWSRCALSAGIHSELELRSIELGWHGFVDLLTLSADVCEIRDFKTGIPKEEHSFQLQAYSLLWLKDHDLNPYIRPVNRLILSYPNNDMEIPVPEASDYITIERSIIERTGRVLISIDSMPPKARLGIDNCRVCQVRHLCNEYWDAQQECAPKLLINKESPYLDMQAIIISRRGPASWDAKIESCYFALSGKPVLILGPPLSLSILEEGDRVRFLNIFASTEGECAGSVTQPLNVSIGNYSEFFILPRF
jgi:hypothetical protein